jgi:hypothetical protein
VAYLSNNAGVTDRPGPPDTEPHLPNVEPTGPELTGRPMPGPPRPGLEPVPAPLVIPGPPALPQIRTSEPEIRTPTAPSPRDAPTPPQRLRADVAATLVRAELAVKEIKEARRHSHSDPVNLVDVLEKIVELSDAKNAARLSEHEIEEKAIAAGVAEKVEAVEKQRAVDARLAMEDRAVIGQKLDKLALVTSAVFDDQHGLPAYRRWIVADFKEAAKTIADRFLEPIGDLIKEVAGLKEKAMEHDLKLSRLYARVDELERSQEDNRREIDKIKQQIRNIMPRPI